MHLTNKEASTVFCSVVKHAESGRAQKKCREKHKKKLSVFPHFLSALPLLSALQQNRTQSRLLYLFHDKESDHFPTHLAEFSNFIFQARKSGVSRVLISHKAH